MSAKRIFIIAGERSGDLHGSHLSQELNRLDPTVKLVGYGGDLMKRAGVDLLSHYREGAFMGFFEVVQNLRKIRRRLKQCMAHIRDSNPDVVVLIDYPGFNLRMAKYAHELGIQVVYYISPKIWAWKKGRIKQIKKYVDTMLVILPFEESFYDSLDYSVKYVGNPLVHQLKEYKYDQVERLPGTHIAFLPGSREQEVRASINMIRLLANEREEYHFWVAGVDNIPIELYAPLKGLRNVEVRIDETYNILKYADAAVVTSGTATLETLLIGTPQVVCYRTSPVSYAIAKRVVKLNYISLVNLIAEREIVRELIQEDYNLENVLDELDRLVNDDDYQVGMKKGYSEVQELIGNANASEEAARIILS